MFKTLTTLSKVLIGTTMTLAAATTMFAMKDKKAAKAAEECTCDHSDKRNLSRARNKCCCHDCHTAVTFIFDGS